MKKRFGSISLRLQAIVGLLVVILVGACALFASQAFERRQAADRVVAITDLSRTLFTALQSLRIERAAINNGLMDSAPPSARFSFGISWKPGRWRGGWSSMPSR
jgi:hypothetical protein